MFMRKARMKSSLNQWGVIVVFSVVATWASSVWAQAPANPYAAGPVDVNAADEATLQTLPGVGPALAKQIMAARPFASLEDLAKVKGIGPAKLAALRDKVVIKGSKLAASIPAIPALAGKASPTAPKAASAPAPAVPTPPTVTMPPASAKAPPTGPAANSAGPSLPGKININTASQAELEKLPGVGPVKAKAIIAGRPYAKPEDITKVPGIKDGIFGKIKNNITVE